MIAEKATERREKRRAGHRRFVEAFFALTGFRPVAAYRRIPAARVSHSIDTLSRRAGRPVRQPPATRAPAMPFATGPGRRPREGWTYGGLLELRGFGVFCLLDVMQALRTRVSAFDLSPLAEPKL